MKQRLVSLDAFRGITIVGMILVNNPGTWGAMYGPFKHAAWHGWTPTDLIFPFFLFIVGVAITYAFGRSVEEGVPKGPLAWKSARRAAVLFGLGVFMAAFPFITWEPELMLRPGLERLRIMGVLQRIGLCYLVVSLLFLYTTRKTQQFLLWALPVWYFAAMWANGVSLDDKIWNLAAVVDRWVLGDHLWAGARRMWDPEGLLSTLPAISTTLIGVWAGRILRETGSGEAKTARLMVVGFLLLSVGYLWGWIMPINKALWTSSYVFFTGGMAMLGLGVCYWFADVKGYQRWTKPFVVYGVNAITVFVMSGLVAKSMGILRVGDLSLQRWVFLTFFDSWLPTIDASLLYSFVWVLAWYAVLHLMWKKNIILKV